MDDTLKKLLRLKLVRHLQAAKPTDSFVKVASNMIQEIKQWLHLPDQVIETNDLQESLMNLMVRTASKHYAIKDMPTDPSEWSRLITHWLRQNTFNNIIKGREIYYLLSVDGFMGFLDLKKYVSNITGTLRQPYSTHNHAVRKMYEWIDVSPIACLTGTDSACVIFLALLKFYEKHLVIYNHDVLTHLNQVRVWTEGLLHQHSNYYRIIKQVNDTLLDELGKVYVNQFSNEEDWKLIGKEQTDKLEFFLYK